MSCPILWEVLSLLLFITLLLKHPSGRAHFQGYDGAAPIVKGDDFDAELRTIELRKMSTPGSLLKGKPLAKTHEGNFKQS